MVDAKETKEKNLREERLDLMRVYIARQREQLQEMSEKLRRRMERRKRKERVPNYKLNIPYKILIATINSRLPQLLRHIEVGSAFHLTLPLYLYISVVQK